jgi:hypothetical protein
MIRSTYLLRRKPGMSRQDFQRCWLDLHGALVSSYAETLGLVRYVQTHTIADDAENARMSGARGPLEPPYDGIEDMWYAGRAEMVEGQRSEMGRRATQAIVEHEREFVDLPASPLWLSHALAQIDPAPVDLVATESGPLIKTCFAIRSLPELSVDRAQLYWRTEHADLVRRIGSAGHIKRYVQVHRCADEMEPRLRAMRGTEVEPYIGHAEMWLERDLASTPEIERGWRFALNDEREFIDFARSAMWYCTEHVVIDNRSGPSPGRHECGTLGM